MKLPKPLFLGHAQEHQGGPDAGEVLGKAPAAVLSSPQGSTNLALKKKVTSSDSEPDHRRAEPGDRRRQGRLRRQLRRVGPGKQWVQIDLEKPADI